MWVVSHRSLKNSICVIGNSRLGFERHLAFDCMLPLEHAPGVVQAPKPSTLWLRRPSAVLLRRSSRGFGRTVMGRQKKAECATIICAMGSWSVVRVLWRTFLGCCFASMSFDSDLPPRPRFQRLRLDQRQTCRRCHLQPRAWPWPALSFPASSSFAQLWSPFLDRRFQ